MGKITCYCNANGARLAIGRFVPPFSCVFKGFHPVLSGRRLTTRRRRICRARTTYGDAGAAPISAPHSGARNINARDGHIAPGDIAVGVVIGRASEYFDFFVYAIASVLVFPAVFFPFADRLEGTLYSFAIFALAYIARPIGTWCSCPSSATSAAKSS
jgi:hypothetical protein